jgi:hypothetical protein
VCRPAAPMQSNYSGIFATHQHSLFDARLGLLPALPRCSPFRMLTPPLLPLCHDPHSEAPVQGDSHHAQPSAGGERHEVARRTTFKVEEGFSDNSLAFQVAREQVRAALPRAPVAASFAASGRLHFRVWEVTL